MLDVMSQAKNAMEAYSTKLRAITSNITNMSVTGFKRSDVSFQDMFSKLLSVGTPAYFSENQGGTNPTQLGGTASISSTSVDFEPGAPNEGGNLDIAIQDGSKLFIVSPDGGKTFLYTRAGEFKIADNKLYTKGGYQVYGFRSSSGVDSSSIEPIDLSGLSYDVTKITWNESGTLCQEYSESGYGAQLPWRIAMTSFNNPSGLIYKDGTNFSESLASGPASAPTVASNNIKPRFREQSNVNYTSEVVDSLEIQRALDASLTVIRMANDTITGFINKIS